MEKIIGFDELQWLLKLAQTTRPAQVPETIGDKLLLRGLIEHKSGGFSLTQRGHIALAKLA